MPTRSGCAKDIKKIYLVELPLLCQKRAVKHHRLQLLPARVLSRDTHPALSRYLEAYVCPQPAGLPVVLGDKSSRPCPTNWIITCVRGSQPMRVVARHTMSCSPRRPTEPIERDGQRRREVHVRRGPVLRQRAGRRPAQGWGQGPTPSVSEASADHTSAEPSCSGVATALRSCTPNSSRTHPCLAGHCAGTCDEKILR